MRARPESRIQNIIEGIIDRWEPENHLGHPHRESPKVAADGQIVSLCPFPFHDDRQPSFSLNKRKGVFHCFGCGAEGGVLELARLLTGEKDAVRALQGLVALWNIEGAFPFDSSPAAPVTPETSLHEEGSAANQPTLPKVEQVGWDISAMWDKFQRIDQSPRALSYLSGRRIDAPPVHDAVRVDGAATTPFLAVPLRDLDGKIRDIQFRNLAPAASSDRQFRRVKDAKKDGAVLVFGQIKSPSKLFIAEGMTDYLTLISLGLSPESVLGIPGSSNSERLFRELKERGLLEGVREITLAFDQDKAGQVATRAAIEQLGGLDADILTMSFAEKDLNEWVQTKGPTSPAMIAEVSQKVHARRRHPWVVPAAEFCAQSPGEPEFLVPGYVHRGAFVLMQGQPNIGKTWLALEFARQVAKRGRILLVEEEGTHGALAKRLRLMNLSGGQVDVSFRQGVLVDDANWMERVESYCSTERVDLLILDPLTDLHRGDENDAPGMRRITVALKKLLTQCPKMAIVLLHHTIKTAWNNESGSRSEHSRGSGALVGAVDIQIGLASIKTGQRGIMRFRVDVLKAREFERTPPAIFSIDVSGQTAEVTSSVIDEPETLPEESEEEFRIRILDSIPANGDIITMESLRPRMKVGFKKLKQTLMQLQLEGLIVRDRRGIQRTEDSLVEGAE